MGNLFYAFQAQRNPPKIGCGHRAIIPQRVSHLIGSRAGKCPRIAPASFAREPQTPPPAVVPRVQGGIQLEWHTETIDIEVYIDSPEKVSFFAEHLESGQNAQGPLAGQEHVLKEWVERIPGK